MDTILPPIDPDCIEQSPVGVLVGRFQVPSLHSGHRKLIESVMNRHQKVVIMLGRTKDVFLSKHDPLDFLTRSAMIRQAFPGVVVMPLQDRICDVDWSERLDDCLSGLFDFEKITLYGSRDSFIPSYCGRWPTVQLADAIGPTGTESRNAVAHGASSGTDFRTGVIYASNNRFPTCFPVVDIAAISICDGFKPTIACIKKAGLSHWQLPGGYVDGSDKTLEASAARELQEETGLVPGVATMRYVSSRHIDSWRYRNSQDSMVSSLFVSVFNGMPPLVAGDDAAEVCEFAICDIAEGKVAFDQDHLKMVANTADFLTSNGLI